MELKHTKPKDGFVNHLAPLEHDSALGAFHQTTIGKISLQLCHPGTPTNAVTNSPLFAFSIVHLFNCLEYHAEALWDVFE